MGHSCNRGDSRSGTRRFPSLRMPGIVPSVYGTVFGKRPCFFALISEARLDCPTDSGDSSFLALANVRRPRALDELQHLIENRITAFSATTRRSPTAIIGDHPCLGPEDGPAIPWTGCCSKALWSHRTRTRSLVGPNGRTKTSYLVRSTPTPSRPSSRSATSAIFSGRPCEARHRQAGEPLHRAEGVGRCLLFRPEPRS
jgi:hypothetical protein